MPSLSSDAEAVVGTPNYIAPEGHRGCVGPLGDVYALGIVTLQVLPRVRTRVA